MQRTTCCTCLATRKPIQITSALVAMLFAALGVLWTRSARARRVDILPQHAPVLFFMASRAARLSGARLLHASPPSRPEPPRALSHSAVAVVFPVAWLGHGILVAATN